MNAGQQYQQINAQTGVVDADPHRLIQLLFSGALDKIAVAKGCIKRNDIAGKGEAISKAVGIVGGLKDSLNHEVADSGLSDNLMSLYEFVTQQLTQANINHSLDSLDDAAKVLKELQAGWADIRPEALQTIKDKQAATV